LSVKGRPGLSVEENPVFLQILALIVNGVDTPIGICEKLGLKPTTLVKYLNVLRKNGLIRYGEKHGKNQPYAVNWDEVAKVFIEAIAGGKLWAMALREVGLIPIGKKPSTDVFPLLKRVEEAMGIKIEELASKPEVLDIVKSGFEELGRDPDAVRHFEMGLRDFFKSFRDMLLKTRGIYELDIKDEALRKLFDNIPIYLFHPGDFDWFKAMKNRGMIHEVKA